MFAYFVVGAALASSVPTVVGDAGRVIADEETVITVQVSSLKSPPEYQPSRCTAAPYTQHQTLGLDTFRNSEKMIDGDNGDRWSFHYGNAKQVTDLSKSSQEQIRVGIDGGRWGGVITTDTTIQSAEDAMVGFEPEEQKFRTWCAAAEDVGEDVKAGDPQPGSYNEFWVPLITEDVLAGYLFLQLDRYLYGPDYDWVRKLNRDGEVDPNGDGIIVKVPWALTVGDTGPITIQATASNMATPGGVSASITARPDVFVFDGGDPEVDPIECSFAELATEGCLYEYYHSSISLSDDGDPYTFATSGYIVWDVSTSANGVGLGDYAPVTRSESTILVGELQAVVIG